MIVTLKIPLNPNKTQEKKFISFSHTARGVYNWGLSKMKENYELYKKTLSLQDLLTSLQELKYKDSNYAWVKEVPEAVTKQSLKDLMVAYKNFYRGTSKLPKFKSRRKTRLAFYQRTDNVYYVEETKRVNITGIGKVKANNYFGWFPKNPKNSRVIYDGKFWFLVVSVEVRNSGVALSQTVLGVDLGIKKLAVRSDGVEVSNINNFRTILQLEKRLKRLQRKVSKKYEFTKLNGTPYQKTKNIIRLEKEIRLLHRRLTNIRETHLHTATQDIVKTKPCRVVMETLNVRGMMKNRHISKAVANQSFFKFKAYLKYKCEFYGIEFVEADTFFPSSKLCSECGFRKSRLSLSERVFICECCGSVTDRDLNAAINLANYKVS